jgi:hypothetical protein
MPQPGPAKEVELETTLAPWSRTEIPTLTRSMFLSEHAHEPRALKVSQAASEPIKTSES